MAIWNEKDQNLLSRGLFLPNSAWKIGSTLPNLNCPMVGTVGGGEEEREGGPGRFEGVVEKSVPDLACRSGALKLPDDVLFRGSPGSGRRAAPGV